MDAKTSIPDFIHISDGKMHDVNVLDMITTLPDMETDKTFIFFTNNYELKATEIAMLYKHRWFIETFFKWIKQHLKKKSYWINLRNPTDFEYKHI